MEEEFAGVKVRSECFLAQEQACRMLKPLKNGKALIVRRSKYCESTVIKYSIHTGSATFCNPGGNKLVKASNQLCGSAGMQLTPFRSTVDIDE